jgi:adenine-specific DNA-methyltransferase
MTENLEPEKLELTTVDIAADKQTELLRLFPEVRTEGGKIDFDRLRLALGETVDVGKERYGMNWPGKADCFKAIRRPSLGTLLPVREESVNFDETENLIIEGDNLEVLKLLQKAYQNKVKMIYIDPPYNTGNDFIYPDNYSENLQTYLEYTGQVDSEGRKFSNNTETDGRFHSKWLNMMYPRLYLARNLLREDGVIFISIDDAEIGNLKMICNEVFGEENFVANLVWEKGRKNDARRFSVGHDYILAFARNLSCIEEISAPWRESKRGIDAVVDEYKRLRDLFGTDNDKVSAGLVEFYRSLPEDNPAKKYSRSRFVDDRGIWRDNNIGWPGGGGPRYDLPHPKTGKPCKVPDDGWRFIESTMKEKVRDGYIFFREDHTQTPFLKSYLYVENAAVATTEDGVGDKQQVMGSVFYRHTQPASDVLKGLFDEKIFENPKDHDILARLIRYCTGENDIVMDFFAGSGTTAHAVLDLNADAASQRKFILTQLPEPTDHKDFKTIAEITKERVRRVIQRHEKDEEGKLNLSNHAKEGFRVLKLATSNFNLWTAATETTTPEILEQQLELHIDHIQSGRSNEDLLYEILLKSSFPPTTPIEALTVEGKTVFSVTGYGMLICLDKQLTHDAIKAMAELKPSLVVCLDEGFAGNDQLKTNAVLIMKAKGVTKFQTI